MTTTTRLIRRPWHQPCPCPRCGVLPVQYSGGLATSTGDWLTGKLWWVCPTCGRRGPKSTSNETATADWNRLAT
jgi:hypothetical protein